MGRNLEWPWMGLHAPGPSNTKEVLGLIVRVAPEVPKTVVFIGTEAGGSFGPRGTGFLFCIRYQEFEYDFLATADHVLDLIDGDVFSVRMNRKDGTASTIQLTKKNKIPHAKRNNDLAIFAMARAADIYDQKFILIGDREAHLSRLANLWPPDVGDEVATVGLYGSHFGETRNIPVVRVGNIAMMPDPKEPVLTQRGYVEAYLIETRSLVGLSGSPVFLNVPQLKLTNGNPQYLTSPTYIPLGMMLGYHLVSTAEDQIHVPRIAGEDQPVPEYSMDERNTGFGVVIPLDRIFDVMEGLHDIMAESAKRKLKNSGFREAGLGPSSSSEKSGDPPATDANPKHQEDFTSLVAAAARKREQEG
jgi:hypothetical protein